jgi:hypothetical protein
MKKIAIPISLLIALLLILVGCETSSSVVKLGEAPRGYTTLTHEGIDIQLSYLNYKDLQTLYGRKNNPFRGYRSGTLIVIEASIQSDAEIQLRLENAQLSTPGGDRGPTSRDEVYDYWYSRLIRNYSSYRGGSGGDGASNKGSLKVITQIIEETIYPQEVNVTAGSESVGYILFDPIRGEKDVNATLTLPVYDDTGELFYEFEFTFTL